MRPAKLPLVRKAHFDAKYSVLNHRFALRSNVLKAERVLGRLFASVGTQSGIHDDAPLYELLEMIPEDREERRYELFLGGWAINKAESPGTLVDWIVSNITSETVRVTTEHVILHASAAVIDDWAVVMPAPPEHGKTTTVAALVRAGWEFLTDEAAPIALHDGLVYPFPRPLMISPTSMAALDGLKDELPLEYEPFRHLEYHVAPDDLRPGCVASPSQVRFFVFPSYASGSRTELTPITRAEAMIRILESCFNLERVGRHGIEALGEVVGGADCYRLSIGSIEPAVELLEGLFQGSESVDRAVAY